MSLTGAIETFRQAVPWVPSAETPREPLEALPCAAVPRVPPVPSDKSTVAENAEFERPESGGQGAESENGEVSDSSIPGNQGNPFQPLTDRMLAETVTRAARRFRLFPAELWAFLSAEDIEALQSGNPAERLALEAFAESRNRTGDRMEGGHELPFPGKTETPATGRPVCCGDCAHFEPDRIGDGSGIGRCGKGIEPWGGLLYPRVERACRGFLDNRSKPLRTPENPIA